MTERRLDPLAGLRECPWCAEPPSPCSTCFECVHDLVSGLLREEDDAVVTALSLGGDATRIWLKRMSEGPDRLILSPCTQGDVVSVAGLTRAIRGEAAVSGMRGDLVVSVTAVAVGLLIVFLSLSLVWRLA